MSLKISNVESLTDSLKCTQCKKLLSVLPVYYCAAIGNVCGRCSSQLNWMISNGTLERAIAYEAVAKYLVFPCTNRKAGCKSELKWDQVEEHEESCNATALICPFNAKIDGHILQCPWEGALADLASHLPSIHKNNVQVNPTSFIMNVHESNIQIFVVTVAEQTFVVLTKYLKDTNKFYCVAMCCGIEPENQFYRYQLELGRYDDYFLILRKNNTEKFCDTTEIIDNYDKMITVDVSSLAAMLGNPNLIIYCKVDVAKKNKKEIAAIKSELKIPVEVSDSGKIPSTNSTVPENVSSNFKNQTPVDKNIPAPGTTNLASNAKLSAKNSPKSAKAKPNGSSATAEISKIVKHLTIMDKQLLEELECPVCSNHMIPPIYICPTGHSLCNHCKDRVKECPSYRVKIHSIRNYTLEKLTTRVQYPCKHADAGCSEILTSQFIKQHEITCIFGSNKCPLKMLPIMCNIKSNSIDPIRHIREKHAEYLVEVNREYSRNIKAPITSSYYVTIHENEIFFICVKHSSTTGPIKFNFLHLGMKKDEPTYRYELQFIDQTNNGMKFIVNQVCQVVMPNVSAAFKNCLNIPLDMLVPFISKRAQPKLFFKFRVEKLCN